ncbi:MAG: hypothetical protein E7J75_11110, partial [Blautia sp.]|nr:hypothetical protein [Blautia sp.]
TILILSQEALFCYPHHFRLLYSPQHSWGIRLFIEILEKVPFSYKNYVIDLQRLASRENFWVDCFQERGECLEQLPAGNNLDFDTWTALKAKNHS